MGNNAKAPKGAKVAELVVGEVGVKIGDMVYAQGSVIPQDLITDEIAPFLVEATVETTGDEVSGEGDAGESL